MFARILRIGLALGDQAVVSMVNLATVLLLARTMPEGGFGRFMLAYLALTLMTSVHNAWVTEAHHVLAAQRQGDAYRRYTVALGILGILVSAGCALVTLGVAAVSDGRWPELAATALGLAAAIVPWNAQEFVRRVFYTQGDARGALLNNAFTYGLQLAGVVALCVFGTATPARLMLVYGAASALGSLLGIWQLRRELVLPTCAQMCATWRESWNFGKWLVGQSLLGYAGQHGHSWLAAALLGPQTLTLYVAATYLANLINPIRNAVSSYLPSMASRAYADRDLAALRAWTDRLGRVMLIALVPAGAILVAISEPLLDLVHGARYSGMGLGEIMSMAVLAQLIGFGRAPTDTAVCATGATRMLFHIHCVPPVLAFTLGAWLTYAHGIQGMAFSALLIQMVLFALSYAAYLRTTRSVVAVPVAATSVADTSVANAGSSAAPGIALAQWTRPLRAVFVLPGRMLDCAANILVRLCAVHGLARLVPGSYAMRELFAARGTQTERTVDQAVITLAYRKHVPVSCAGPDGVSVPRARSFAPPAWRMAA